MLAVAKVQIVQILPKLDDTVGHGFVCDIPTFRQDQIAQAGRSCHDFINCLVCEELTTSEIQNA